MIAAIASKTYKTTKIAAEEEVPLKKIKLDQNPPSTTTGREGDKTLEI